MYFGRGPNKIQSPYTIKDMYTDYYDNLIDKEESPYYVTYNEYIKICELYYKEIAEAIIQDGLRFKMPHGMGELFVVKKKINYNRRMPIDWTKTVENKGLVYNFNEHSSGFRYVFFWRKTNRIVGAFLYRLVMTRTNKRNLAKAIKENKMDYFEF